MLDDWDFWVNSAEESSDIADQPPENAPTSVLPQVIQPGNGSSPQEAKMTAVGPRYRKEHLLAFTFIYNLLIIFDNFS